MKVATFNINGINQRLGALVRWLDAAKPDAVCLQEIKCTDATFPAAALEAAGYGSVWRGQGRDHGVAILARGATPLETRRELPGDAADNEARYIEAAVAGVLIGCLYLPNGNPQPGPKFDYKLRWMDRLLRHAAELDAADIPTILAGDFNVVPTDHDIYSTRSWLKNALLQPAARDRYQALLTQGWTDALADMHPHDQVFTFWAYLRDSWPRDAGLRIDHLLVSQTLVERLLDCGVDRDVRGEIGASDHAPTWIQLSWGASPSSGP